MFRTIELQVFRARIFLTKKAFSVFTIIQKEEQRSHEDKKLLIACK